MAEVNYYKLKNAIDSTSRLDRSHLVFRGSAPCTPPWSVFVVDPSAFVKCVSKSPEESPNHSKKWNLDVNWSLGGCWNLGADWDLGGDFDLGGDWDLGGNSSNKPNSLSSSPAVALLAATSEPKKECIRIFPGNIFGWYEDGKRNVTMFDTCAEACFLSTAFIEVKTVIEDNDVIGLMIYCGSDKEFLCNHSCILDLCIFEYCNDECVTLDGFTESKVTRRPAFYLLRNYPECAPCDTFFHYYPLAMFRAESLGFLSITHGDIYVSSVGGADAGGSSVPMSWDMKVVNCEENEDCLTVMVYAPAWQHDDVFTGPLEMDGKGCVSWTQFNATAATDCKGYVLGRFDSTTQQIDCTVIFCSCICYEELSKPTAKYAVFAAFNKTVTTIVCEETGCVEKCLTTYAITQLSHGIPNTTKPSFVTGPICFAPNDGNYCPGTVFPARLKVCCGTGTIEVVEYPELGAIACYHAKNPDILFRDPEGSEPNTISHACGWVFELCPRKEIFKVVNTTITNSFEVTDGGNETSQGEVNANQTPNINIVVGVEDSMAQTKNTLLYTEVISANEQTTYENAQTKE